jgi:hypothetical protein
MSTKSSIKFEWDEDTGDYFHIYMDGLEYENVYLELTGFPIEVDIRMGEIKPMITVQLSLAWALKLGIVDQDYVARHEPFIPQERPTDQKPMSPERMMAMSLSNRAKTKARFKPRGMKPSDFKIGLEFWMSGSRWRCTDVGSRVVVAIKLDQYDDPIWYSGPSYKVGEHSLDEYDLMVCSLREGEGNSYPKMLDKDERDAMTGIAFRIYEERFNPQTVYLELTGFPIELDIKMDNLKSSVTARFPLAWAHKIGIVDQEYVARQIQSVIDRKLRTPMAREERFESLVNELRGNTGEKSDKGVETDEEC